MTKAKSEKTIKLTLVRSTSGRNVKHQETIKCLGLRRMHHSVVVADNPAIRGMINKVAYMLSVEES